MARETFDRKLGQLKGEVLKLGSMVEEAIQESVNSLVWRDAQKAHLVCANDQAINAKRFALENAVLIQIATQQPMAHDLRSLAAILEIITDLERMGDYAKGIAKVSLLLEDSFISIPTTDFLEMTHMGISMLHRGLAAFIEDDYLAAQKIAAEDDEVDQMYNCIYQEIVAAMIINPSMLDQSNYLVWVAHNLERLADRVVNICERTIFTSTGELLELDGEGDGELLL
ncbi:MAG: phosphate signaling complex protein PhoU [Anaerolineaceae bacterium]|nr:phosphate signaling complex protein PhoU [Anaerolineaceae bacterium]